jgi:hypothetical protein
MSKVLDPAAQRARDNERASRSLQNAQFLSLSQQLRDSQTTLESLRSKVTELQSQVYTANAARDRAELRLEFMEMAGSRSSMGSYHQSRFASRRANRVKKWVKEVHDDGGGFTYPPYDEEFDRECFGVSDKENIIPGTRHTTPSRPSRLREPPAPSQCLRVFNKPSDHQIPVTEQPSSSKKIAASALLSLSSPVNSTTANCGSSSSIGDSDSVPVDNLNSST